MKRTTIVNMAAAHILKHNLFKLIVNYLETNEYECVKKAIINYKTVNSRKEHEIFECPIELDLIQLYDMSGFLFELLIREPLYMQHIIQETFLMLLKKNYQDLNKLDLNQIDCSLIVKPTRLLTSNNPGLCNLEGILLEKSIIQKYLFSSTWFCNTCNVYQVRRECKAIDSQCFNCQTIMKELIQDRRYRECVYLKIGNFNAAPDTRSIEILDSHVEKNGLLNFRLGTKYLLTASLEENVNFKGWGVATVDNVPIPLSCNNQLIKLRTSLGNDPWAFSLELAERISLGPRNMFVTLKIGILLSLCSTKTNDPIPIIVVTDDVHFIHKLMMNASKFSERFLPCTHLTNLLGSTKENWFCGGAFHIARNGICYLTDWNIYNKKCKGNITNVMESKSIRLSIGESADSTSLRCAIWSYLEARNKNATTEMLTLSKIFGLIWRVNKISSDEEDELATYILNDTKPETNLDADIKKYIEYVNEKDVEISDEALHILQHYFISIRKIRGPELPLTSFEPLQSMTEANARLNDRSIAVAEDALLSVQLCERNLGYSSLIPAPPSDLILFKLWFQKNLGYNFQFHA